MISVLRELIPIFFCLYALDCLALVSATRMLFVRHGGGPFRMKRRGIAVAPFLPGGLVYAASRPAVLFGLSGSFIQTDRTLETSRFRRDAYTFLPYSELGAEEHQGAVLKVNGYTVRVGSADEAVAIGKALEALRNAQASERISMVRKALSSQFDVKGLRERRRAFRSESRVLLDICWVSFFFVFVALPLSVYVPGLEAFCGALSLAALASYAAVLFLAARAARRLRSGGVPVSGSLIAGVAMSPPTAPRARLNLTRDVFSGFDFVCVGAMLLPRDRLADLLRRELHGCRIASQESDPDWSFYWGLRLDNVQALCGRVGRRHGEVIWRPQLKDSASRAYCVFCEAEYTDLRLADCSDCAFPLLQVSA